MVYSAKGDAHRIKEQRNEHEELIEIQKQQDFMKKATTKQVIKEQELEQRQRKQQ